MSRLSRVLALLGFGGMWVVGIVAFVSLMEGEAVGPDNSCLECHMEEEDEYFEPTVGFEKDVHSRAGLGCAGCHGGDPHDPEDTAMDEEKGFLDLPELEEVDEFCGRCHADARIMHKYDPEAYVFSRQEILRGVHYKRVVTDPKTATCTSCHGVHGILPIEDPNSPVHPTNVPETCASCHNADYLKGRKIPTDQHELYVESVHGKKLLEEGDLEAPACNDCHGNHGAASTALSDISLMCGNCHGRAAELFMASRTKAVMDSLGQKGCAECHGNHEIQHPSDDMLSVGPDGTCGDCHEPGSHADLSTRIILAKFDSLETAISEAETLLVAAGQRGMETEYGHLQMDEAHNFLIGSRVLLHGFDTPAITGALGEGMEFAQKARVSAEDALKDWRDRRVGLVAALAVILILILLIVFRIKILESNRPATD